MFVALDLPDAARESLTRWRDELIAGRSELRPVAPEALHVTLAFLGWQDEARAGEIASAGLETAAGTPAPRLRPRAVKAVPPRAPRLFALDLDDAGGRCGELQAMVAAALEAGGFYRREARPFWPHITLARVKGRARAEPPGELAPPAEPFAGAALTLYRSTLRPQGALYEALGRVPLDDA
jgi:2'-5' RNA ligase